MAVASVLIFGLLPAIRASQSDVAGTIKEGQRTVARRYRHFRRFAVGFYDPAFRDLFFARSRRFGIYEAVLSVLAGNWRPTPGTRLRLFAFFGLVALQRVLPIAARSHSASWAATVRPPRERTVEAGR